MANPIELSYPARFLIENASTFSVFDRAANAHRTPIQRAVAITLRPLMLATASGKASHWFDYRQLPEAEKYEGLALPVGKNAFDVYHPNIFVHRIRLIRMSLGGWKDTVLIGPDPERADLDRLTTTGWLYGYRVYRENAGIDAQYSQMINPGFHSILVLRGPHNFDAIGLDPETLAEVPLTGIETFKRGATIQ